MTQLSRVPAPRSPLDRWWRPLAVVLAVGLVTLLVKPWAPPAEPSLTVTAGPSPSRVASVAVAGPLFDPASLGPAAPEPAWELWTSERVTRIPFDAPADGLPPEATVEPASAMIIGGPVIDLGTAEALTAIALNRPLGTELGAVRMWRLIGGRHPERVELAELQDPWGADNVRVFAVQGGDRAAGTVGRWQPGLYRLDLLVEPVGRIRMLLLSAGSADGSTRGGLDATDAVRAPALATQLLRRLPLAAELWAFGRLLSGWSRPSGDPRCRVAEIWRARDVDDACYPTPVGRPSAIGVNLGTHRPVESLEVRQIDPLPGPVEASVTLEVEDRPGLAMATLDAGRFPDGIYRLDATTASDGRVGWYIEVGPDPLERLAAGVTPAHRPAAGDR